MIDNSFFTNSAMGATPCKLCGINARSTPTFRGISGLTSTYISYTCLVCGNYGLDDVLYSNFDNRLSQDDLSKLRCATKINTERNTPLFIDDTNYHRYLASIHIAQDPIEGIDNLLLRVNNKMDYQTDKVIIIIDTEYPLFFAKKAQELNYWINSAEKQDLIRKTQSGIVTEIRLLHEGWLRLRQLRKDSNKESKSVFVAMSFQDSVQYVYTEGIAPLLNEKPFEYQPVQLNYTPHNGQIDNKIVAEIKKAKFVIADFTLPDERPTTSDKPDARKITRDGIYFECGLAQGLGIDIIRTCHVSQKHELHFDVNHYPVIFWDNIDDLKKKLTDWIEATII